METKVRKVGNALGMIFPKGLVEIDEKYVVEKVADKIVLTPKKEEDFYLTAEPFQFHREHEWKHEESEGNETW